MYVCTPQPSCQHAMDIQKINSISVTRQKMRASKVGKSAKVCFPFTDIRSFHRQVSQRAMIAHLMTNKLNYCTKCGRNIFPLGDSNSMGISPNPEGQLTPV